MNVQNNIDNLKQVTAELENHPMCLQFREEKHHLVVVFPYEVKGIGGVRVEKTTNKSRQISLLLQKCEEYWKLGNAWGGAYA